MGAYWQLLLNKFANPEAVGLPALRAAEGHRGEGHDCQEKPRAQHDARAFTQDGQNYVLPGDRPPYAAARMAYALCRAESRAF